METIGAGYSIYEGVFSEEECLDLAEALADRSRGRAGIRHLLSHPAVMAAAVDERLLCLARDQLGASAIPFRATLFEKSGTANWLVAWHQDTTLPLVSKFEQTAWGPWSQKAGITYAHAPAWALARVCALRLHLDFSTRENGPLRVIPGSHRSGVLSDATVFELARVHAAVECVVGRGGVLCMRPLLLHASSKALIDSPRRVLHIEYAHSLDLAPGIRLAIA